MPINLDGTSISGKNSQYVVFDETNNVARVVVNGEGCYILDTITFKVNSISGSLTGTSSRSGTKVYAAYTCPTSTASVTVTLSKPFPVDASFTITSSIIVTSTTTVNNGKSIDIRYDGSGSTTLTIPAGETTATKSFTCWSSSSGTSSALSTTSAIATTYIGGRITINVSNIATVYKSVFNTPIYPTVPSVAYSITKANTLSDKGTATASLSTSGTKSGTVAL